MTTDNSTTDIATLFWNEVALCSHPAPCQTCCWEWQGRHTNNKWNYGRMTIQGKTYPAHRLAWYLPMELLKMASGYSTVVIIPPVSIPHICFLERPVTMPEMPPIRAAYAS